ncbi:MAG: hypothetical protein VYA34_05850 [Myxococcota bacterium]|nr:hypothetical protein [Myxococcota bacterium]
MSGVRTNVNSGQMPGTVADATGQPPAGAGDATGVSESGSVAEILQMLAADGVLGAQSPQEKQTIGALGNLSEPFTPSEGKLDPVAHREAVQQFSAGLNTLGETSMTGDIGATQKMGLVDSMGGQISRDQEGIEELSGRMQLLLAGAASKNPEDMERMNLVSDAVNALPQEVLDSVTETLGMPKGSLSGDFVNALFKKLQTENEGNDREDQVKMQDVKSKQRTSDIERAKEAQAEAADKAEEAAKKAEELKTVATILTIVIIVVAIVMVIATWGAAAPAAAAASGVAAGSTAAASANVVLALGIKGTAVAAVGAMNAGCNAVVADAQFEANEADVQSKRHRLDADKAQAMIQEWNEQMQAIMEVIAKMFQGLNKLQTGRHQANQQAVDTLFH